MAIQKDNLIEEQAQLEQPEIETAQQEEPVRKKPGRKPGPKPEKKVKVERNEIYHEFAKKSNAGRKSKYDPALMPKLAESYAMEGFKDTEIAEKLGIHTATLYDWSSKYSEFSEALKKGKEPVNADIKASMLKTAFGYFVEETETTTTYNPQTREATSIRKTTKKRYIAPNATMQLFLAQNRMPEVFKNVNRRETPSQNDSGAGLTISDLIAEDAFESAASGVSFDAGRQGDVQTED